MASAREKPDFVSRALELTEHYAPFQLPTGLVWFAQPMLCERNCMVSTTSDASLLQCERGNGG